MDGDAITKAARDLSQDLWGKRNGLGDKQEYDLEQFSTLLQEVVDTRKSQVTDDDLQPGLRVPAPRVPAPRVLSLRVHTNPAGLEELENEIAHPVPSERERVRMPSRAVREDQVLDVEP